MPIVVSPAWSTATPVETNKLVDKVARLYGLQDDSEARAVALDCLDDCVKEMNTHLYEFNVVVESGLTMVEGTSSVQLSSPFFKEKLAYLVKTSDSKSSAPLYYLDWATFQRLYGTQSEQGRPGVYATRNIQEEGLVYLAPTPDSDSATNYTLTVEYYRRIPLPSETQQFTIPQEAENTLLYGGRKRFSIEIAGIDSQEWRSFEILEQQSLNRLTGIDKRHPDEVTRFRCYDYRSRGRRANNPGPFYIRIT